MYCELIANTVVTLLCVKDSKETVYGDALGWKECLKCKLCTVMFVQE